MVKVGQTKSGRELSPAEMASVIRRAVSTDSISKLSVPMVEDFVAAVRESDAHLPKLEHVIPGSTVDDLLAANITNAIRIAQAPNSQLIDRLPGIVKEIVALDREKHRFDTNGVLSDNCHISTMSLSGNKSLMHGTALEDSAVGVPLISSSRNSVAVCLKEGSSLGFMSLPFPSYRMAILDGSQLIGQGYTSIRRDFSLPAQPHYLAFSGDESMLVAGIRATGFWKAGQLYYRDGRGVDGVLTLPIGYHLHGVAVDGYGTKIVVAASKGDTEGEKGEIMVFSRKDLDSNWDDTPTSLGEYNAEIGGLAGGLIAISSDGRFVAAPFFGTTIVHDLLTKNRQKYDTRAIAEREEDSKPIYTALGRIGDHPALSVGRTEGIVKVFDLVTGKEVGSRFFGPGTCPRPIFDDQNAQLIVLAGKGKGDNIRPLDPGAVGPLEYRFLLGQSLNVVG